MKIFKFSIWKEQKYSWLIYSSNCIKTNYEIHWWTCVLHNHILQVDLVSKCLDKNSAGLLLNAGIKYIEQLINNFNFQFPTIFIFIIACNVNP
jgi:hypothetical protein